MMRKWCLLNALFKWKWQSCWIIQGHYAKPSGKLQHGSSWFRLWFVVFHNVTLTMMLGRWWRRPAQRTEGECGGMYVTRPALTPPSSYKPVALRSPTETTAFSLIKSHSNLFFILFHACCTVISEISTMLNLWQIIKMQERRCLQFMTQTFSSSVMLGGHGNVYTVTHRKWKFGKSYRSL